MDVEAGFSSVFLYILFSDGLLMFIDLTYVKNLYDTMFKLLDVISYYIIIYISIVHIYIYIYTYNNI